MSRGVIRAGAMPTVAVFLHVNNYRAGYHSGHASDSHSGDKFESWPEHWKS